MKNLVVIIIMALSFSLSAQVDTTLKINTDLNYPRSPPFKGAIFQRTVADFTSNSSMSLMQILVEFSNTASAVTGKNILYSFEQIAKMQTGEFIPTVEIQIAILNRIVNLKE
jgi:hypothetical protein